MLLVSLVVVYVVSRGVMELSVVWILPDSRGIHCDIVVGLGLMVVWMDALLLDKIVSW